MKALNQNYLFRNRASVLLLIFVVHLSNVMGQNSQSFTLVDQRQHISISIDKNEARVVHIAADILAADILKVSGKVVKVSSDHNAMTLVAGTIGNSQFIDRLIKEKKIDVNQVENKWETFSIQVIEKPTDGIEKALVIVGSDRRGTAFGLLEVSRMIGVSPWEWWADVTPDKKEELIISIEAKVYGSPSVKYRGIFLNDEDWGLQRWAALNFEPETKDIGPKTYAKVFELLLRLRANTIWPAMHSCTKPFYFYPENKQVADDYAIVVGTSHCEPMLCNVNAEWDNKAMGAWRYDTNASTIKDLFESRAKESFDYESIYTMGMRGEHDSPMIVGEDDTESQVKLLQNVVQDQRDILGKSDDRLPQIFIPYKEVLTYYQNGMDLPDDISLVWTDDNYGYIRQLSTPEEQRRAGGAGVYYHTSYWGRPHDYLWLNSTNPVLMWEEMSKAYEFQSRNLWILNCGDIKPHEYNIELFLDMAWDISVLDKSERVKQHMQHWARREFGEQNAQAVTTLMYEYYRLAFQRRPEFMSWSRVEPVSKAGATELNQIHYGDEVSLRIQAYQELVDAVNILKTQMADNRKDAFYELVYYPVIGAANLNFKWLYAYKNIFTAQQGRWSAAYFGAKSQEAFRAIQRETNYYNKELRNGKWNHIMSMSPRNLPVFSVPSIATSSVSVEEAQLGLALESYEMEVNDQVTNSYANVLPVFNAYTHSSYFIDVFLTGKGNVDWKALPKADWIQISEAEGSLGVNHAEQRLWVSIDWDKVPAGVDEKEAPLGHDYQLIPPSYKVNSSIDFISGDSVISIGVSVYNPEFKALNGYNGFCEDKGFVSINAEHYSSKKAGNQAVWEIVEGLGYSGHVMRAMPYTSDSQMNSEAILANSPVLEYDFYSFNFGQVDVLLKALPSHAFNANRGVRCAIAIDDAEPVMVDFQTSGRSDEWMQNVLKNASVQSAEQIVYQSGKHKLKVWMVDPGVMLDQILINFGGWKTSYSFPQESKIQ